MSKKHRKQHTEPQVSTKPKSGWKNITRKSWLPVALFVVVAVAFYADPFFNNKGFFSTEGSYRPFTIGETGFKSALTEMPVWGDYVGGLPAADRVLELTRDVTWSVFSVFLPTDHKQIAAYHMLLMIVAAVGFYKYVRLIGVGRVSATVLALNYQLSPLLLSLNLSLHQSKMGVIALIPFLFLGAERLARYGRLSDALVLCAAMVAVLYTGHLQMAYFAYIGLGCYVLFRAVQLMREGEDRRRYLSKAGLCAAAMIVAMLINARGLLPQYYNATKVSKRVEQTVSSGDAAVDEARKNFSTSWSLHPEEVASLVVPEFAGYNQGYWGRNYFKINVEYFGLLPVALALAGFAGLYQSSLFLFFAALGAFGITFGLGAHLPVHGIVAAVLPGIKSLRGPSMMAILTAFSASVMAALALQALLKSPDKKHRQRDKRGTMLGVLVGITGVFLISSIATESILSLWTTIFDYAPTAGKLQAYQANIPLLTKASMIALVFLGSVTALLFAYRAKKVSLMVIVCVMACVSLIDNWRINTQFMRLTTPDYHGTGKMPTVPAFEWLKDNDTSKYRIFPLYNPQGRLFYDGINSVSGQHDFTLQRYDVLMANLNNFGILNLANVKYFVSQQPVQALQNFNIVYNDKQLLIYENPNAYPFVYLATAAQIETDEEVILDALRSNTRFEQTVILEVEPNPEWGLADQPVAGGSVTVVDMDVSAGRYEMDVDAPAPGVVVVSDNFHPHWTATVNANEVEILHANYFWKGVVVAAGKSRIVMQFQTPLIDTSRRISQAGVLIFFLAGLWVGVQYLRERKAGAVTVADA